MEMGDIAIGGIAGSDYYMFQIHYVTFTVGSAGKRLVYPLAGSVRKLSLKTTVELLHCVHPKEYFYAENVEVICAGVPFYGSDFPGLTITEARILYNDYINRDNV